MPLKKEYEAAKKESEIEKAKKAKEREEVGDFSFLLGGRGVKAEGKETTDKGRSTIILVILFIILTVILMCILIVTMRKKIIMFLKERE